MGDFSEETKFTYTLWSSPIETYIVDKERRGNLTLSYPVIFLPFTIIFVEQASSFCFL